MNHWEKKRKNLCLGEERKYKELDVMESMQMTVE